MSLGDDLGANIKNLPASCVFTTVRCALNPALESKNAKVRGFLSGGLVAFVEKRTKDLHILALCGQLGDLFGWICAIV